MSGLILTFGVVPVADYALPGTNEVPASIEPYVRSHNAVLLANHGLLTYGYDIPNSELKASKNHVKQVMLIL